MALYVRCVKELTKPNVIEMHKNQLEQLPVPAKTEILYTLCRRGYFKDDTIFGPLLSSSLVTMDLGECVVTDEMLNCLRVCKFLRKLDLSLRRMQERLVTTKGLVSLFPYLRFLEVLEIPDCKEFNDEVTKTICESCLRLKQLHIQNSAITNHSLSLIGQHLNFLSVLNILGTKVDDKGIESLASGPSFDHLTEVNIERCPYVTPASSKILGEKCRDSKCFTTTLRSEGSVCFSFGGVLPHPRGSRQPT